MDFNISSNSGDIHPSQTEKVLILATCSIVACLIILGNLLVILAFLTRSTLRQVRSNIFIFSLAVTDLFVGVFVLPLNIEFQYYDHTWIHSPAVCFLWVFSDTVACTASVWTMAAIAVDRMIAVVYPVTYMSMKHFSTAIGVCVVWVFSVITCIPTFMEISYEHCRFEIPLWTLVTVSMLAFYVPLAILTLSYIIIFVSLRLKIKKRTQHHIEMRMTTIRPNGKRFSKEDVLMNISRKTSSTALTQLSVPSTPDQQRMLPPFPRSNQSFRNSSISKRFNQAEKNLSNAPPTPSSSAFKASVQRERRVLIQMSVLVLAFLVCCLPFWIHFSIVGPVCILNGLCTYPHWLDSGTQWLAYCNSVINPILYTIFNTEYRLAFKEILSGKILM